MSAFRLGFHEPPAVTNLRARGLLEVAERHAKNHHLLVEEVLGRSRADEAVAARTALWRELRDHWGMSIVTIAGLFDRHHSTIIYALNGERKRKVLAQRRLYWRRTRASAAQSAISAMRVI